MRVLAIDQGTSATKAVVVESDGSAGAVCEYPVAIHATADGGVELDPEALWESVVGAGRLALDNAGGAVDAIGLANQGETILAWERRSGRPLSNGIVWQDTRSESLCRSMEGLWGNRLRAITGLQLDPYFVAPKIAWLAPQVIADATITTTDTWLLHRLCGAFVTDVATASRTLLLDLDLVSWSPEACEAFGIDPATLPALVPNAGTVGATTVFGGSIPIAGLCVDQQAALFAESCHAAGEVKCTYGTGAFLLASTGAQPIRSQSGLVGCVAWQLADGSTTWCLDGQVFTAGAAVSWLQSVGVINEPADLDRLGFDVENAGGARFIPGLAGLAAPFWKPSARGALTGLSLSTGRSELVRAVVDGIAASVAVLAGAAAADLGKPLTRLRVDGGLTRSRLMLQRQADLAQLPVEVYPSPHATALGVAAFARHGLGDTAHRRWAAAATVEPSITADEAADELADWTAAVLATAAL